jgi:hypothetical protein
MSRDHCSDKGTSPPRDDTPLLLAGLALATALVDLATAVLEALTR